MNKNNEKLFYDALSEIADHIGDSFENPISLSLLCLTLGIKNEEKGKIFISWNKVLNETNFNDLTIDLFKNELEAIVSNVYDDKVIKALIKAYSKDLIVELYPFSKTLD